MSHLLKQQRLKGGNLPRSGLLEQLAEKRRVNTVVFPAHYAGRQPAPDEEIERRDMELVKGWIT